MAIEFRPIVAGPLLACELCGLFRCYEYLPDAEAEWWPISDEIEGRWPFTVCICELRRQRR